MKKVVVRLALFRVRDGSEVQHDWPGYAVVSGLAVIRTPLRFLDPWADLSPSKYWAIVHVGSGRMLHAHTTAYRTRRQARANAERLASLADWTLPQNELFPIPGLREAVSEIVEGEPA